jgi:hypothetical protein
MFTFSGPIQTLHKSFDPARKDRLSLDPAVQA